MNIFKPKRFDKIYNMFHIHKQLRCSIFSRTCYVDVTDSWDINIFIQTYFYYRQSYKMKHEFAHSSHFHDNVTSIAYK